MAEWQSPPSIMCLGLHAAYIPKNNRGITAVILGERPRRSVFLFYAIGSEAAEIIIFESDEFFAGLGFAPVISTIIAIVA